MGISRRRRGWLSVVVAVIVEGVAETGWMGEKVSSRETSWSIGDVGLEEEEVWFEEWVSWW